MITPSFICGQRLRNGRNGWPTCWGPCREKRGPKCHEGDTQGQRIVIELYEQKIEPPEIAARVKHSQEAVDRYIKDYERIKFLARRGIDEDEMVLMTGRGKTVIRQYMRLLRKHHPEIVNGE
ncbi:MAG: DUF1670 domain-containing protein [Firmicutes bacterium]|nr:DUF1670 domain-containing protein [Bacillota bacterium]